MCFFAVEFGTSLVAEDAVAQKNRVDAAQAKSDLLKHFGGIALGEVCGAGFHRSAAYTKVGGDNVKPDRIPPH